MFIKIEMPDEGKTALHEAESYYINKLADNTSDFNIKSPDGDLKKYHFPDITIVDVFVMNEQGKTIDRLF